MGIWLSAVSGGGLVGDRFTSGALTFAKSDHLINNS